ncbi:3-oxoacyl-[acyl-carrier-protein] reductase FabG-like [Convolutriloba macropyga]|uniref:3-oxoacyl-[acyl-carrier-protein] reductase FabG-like n=1 Tax=Convolutriloba macropyga TaxID=536237 RepID=UPI003F51E239
MKLFSDEKVVIITGASSGIGQETAVKFVEKGITKLCLNGRNGEGLEKTKQDCLAVNKDADVLLVQGDLRSEGICEKIVNGCIAKFGRIDILFNNAGLTKIGLIVDQPIENYETVFDVNVKSAIRLTKLCIPYLRETKGNIVNNSSILANTPIESMGYYCMSKAALDMFTKCIALEEGKNGIRANNINPGNYRIIETPFVVNAGIPKELYEQAWAKLRKDHPIGRLGFGQDVASLVMFVASEQADFMSGSSVVMDGGHFSLTANMEMDTAHNHHQNKKRFPLFASNDPLPKPENPKPKGPEPDDIDDDDDSKPKTAHASRDHRCN